MGISSPRWCARGAVDLVQGGEWLALTVPDGAPSGKRLDSDIAALGSGVRGHAASSPSSRPPAVAM